VEAVRSKAQRPTTGPTGAQKLEVRRLQTLTKQRKRLEDELKVLESEVDGEQGMSRLCCVLILAQELEVLQP